MIWATGNENSGMSVFVQNDRLVVDYNSFNNHTIVESAGKVPTGDVTLQVHLERDSRTTGWAEVSINGKASGRGEIPFYMRMVSSIGSSVGTKPRLSLPAPCIMWRSSSRPAVMLSRRQRQRPVNCRASRVARAPRPDPSQIRALAGRLELPAALV